MKEGVYQVRGEGEAHSIIAPAAQNEQQMWETQRTGQL